MKRILAFILAMLMISAVAVGVISCNSGDEAPTNVPTDAPSEAQTDEPTEKKTEKSTANADTRPELSVLFIGNSYTYYNSLWTIFRGLASKAGYKVTVSSITSGGYTLEKFADDVRASDPMSDEALSGIEQTISSIVSEIMHSVAYAEEQQILALIEKGVQELEARNRRCLALK